MTRDDAIRKLRHLLRGVESRRGAPGVFSPGEAKKLAGIVVPVEIVRAITDDGYEPDQEGEPDHDTEEPPL